MSRALDAFDDIEHVTIHTGQHYDKMLSGVFFNELNIKEPDYHLGLAAPNRSCPTGEMMLEIEKMLPGIKPGIVLVYGDTNSTMAAALAASKLDFDIAHVEAGLRCGDMTMPEELNRCVTDRLSKILLCPTESARRNLESERNTGDIFVPGDVMVDTFFIFRESAIKQSSIIDTLTLDSGKYLLLTVHRAENTNDPENLISIMDGCGAAERRIIFPAHPRTINFMKKHGIATAPNVELIEPVSYIDMLALEAGAAKILTDSGGVQKEAYLAGGCLAKRPFKCGTAPNHPPNGCSPWEVWFRNPFLYSYSPQSPLPAW